MNLRDALQRAGVPDDKIDAVLATLPKPDASNWNPDPDYLYSLTQQAGLNLREVSEIISVQHRQLRYYIAGRVKAPYTVQYALEMLALLNIPENAVNNGRIGESSNGQD